MPEKLGAPESDVDRLAVLRDARYTAALTELLCVYFDESPVKGTTFRQTGD